MAIKNIAVVVPTIRMKESIPAFMEAWKPLFEKHNVELILVDDTGDIPKIIYNNEAIIDFDALETNLISNKCAGVRQLGFLYIAKYLPDVEYIFTTDDDCFPIGDPIAEHIYQLQSKVSSLDWMNTCLDVMPRGYPYADRNNIPVMLSHGVWKGVPDLDAPTQLLNINQKLETEFYEGKIPRGIYFPMCGMNLAFRREALPYIYFAPVGQFKGAERWDDIFAGILIVKKFAELNWGIVSGYAKVNHLRASNVFTSLAKEAVGIRHGEEFWKDPENYKGDPWFDEFREKTLAWYNLTK